MLSYQPVIPVPFMTFDQYALHSGISIHKLRQMQNDGRLIVKKKDTPREHPQVNIIAMYERAAREAHEFLG